MGGTSTSNTTQQSSTSPWATGQTAVNGILGQLNPLLANSGLNSTESGAINQLTQNAQQGNPYAGQIGGVASNLLNGGGATNQSGALNSAYQNYYNQTNPLASNTNYDPTQAPGMQALLQQISGDVGNSVNGQFAAAGRDMSGMNQQTLARGISQGEAAPLLAQYNQNVSNQQGAAQNLYNAGNTTAGAQAGLTQQGVNNQLNGITAANSALQAQNYGPTATLAAQQLGQSIPAQNLGLLAQIGIPIAGLGTNATGQSNTTNNESGAQQFGQIAGGLGGLFGGAGGGAVGGAGSAITGLLGFLSDRRLKEEIMVVGALFDGTPVYRYRYKGQRQFQIGLMAQDVEKYAPEAVTEIDGGIKTVEYKAATEKAAHVLDWGC